MAVRPRPHAAAGARGPRDRRAARAILEAGEHGALHAAAHYHEQMRLASEEERCDITVGSLRERLVHAGKPIAQLSRRALGHALRRLHRHSLVHVERGFEAEDEEVIVVTPLVEKVLPEDRIQDIVQRIKAYAGTRLSAAPSDGDSETDLVSDEIEPETAS